MKNETTGLITMGVIIFSVAYFTSSAYGVTPPPADTYRTGTAGGTGNKAEHVYVDINNGEVTSNRQSQPFADHVMQSELDASTDTINNTIENTNNNVHKNTSSINDINLNNSLYNTQANSKFNVLDSRVGKLESRVDQLESAVAISNALSGIPQSHRSYGTTIGLGVGNYAGKNAVAIGISRNNGSVSFKFSFGVSESESAVSAGVGYNF